MFAVFSCNPVHFDVLFCCVILFQPPLSAEQPLQSAGGISEQTAGSDSDSLSRREPTTADLPFFLSVPDRSVSDNAALSDDLPDVGNIHQLVAAALPKCNRDSKTATHRKSTVFKYLNYVTMNCDSAFEEDASYSLILLCCGHDELSKLSIAVDDSSPEASPDVSVSPNSQSTLPQTSATRRPLSAIRLSESLQTASESGDRLPTPNGIDKAAQTTHTTEHHFVPAPWLRSHPPRNTFQVRHQPLYFEDPNMERCGASNGCLTEATSIFHFASRIPLLPYMMASNSPHECVNALPDCPTSQNQKFDLEAYMPRPTLKAVAVQAAATVGGAYIIP